MAFQVRSVYDPGTAKFLEDKAVIYSPFFGVLDGVSGLYDPEIGPRLFDGKSGGQKVVEIVERTFSGADPEEKLTDIVNRANSNIREFSESNGIDMNRADLLPGTTFVFAKISGDNAEIIQGGDCFALWETADGKSGVTANPNFSDEEEKINILNGLIGKHGGDRARGWTEYMPISARLRVERVNKNFDKTAVVLNGQPEGEKFWHKAILPLKNLKTLLLFTDGMIEFSEGRDPEKMGAAVLDSYRKGGVQGMLSRIRDIEKNRRQVTHISNAEATALAIEF